MNMSKNTDNDAFSETFRNKLSQHEIPVDDQCWDEIEARLNQKKKKRIIPLWWLYTGGAVAVVILFFSLINLNPVQNNQHLAQQKNSKSKQEIIQSTPVDHKKVKTTSIPNVLTINNSHNSSQAKKISISKRNDRITVSTSTEKSTKGKSESKPQITLNTINSEKATEFAEANTEKKHTLTDTLAKDPIKDWEDPLKNKKAANDQWTLIAAIGSGGGGNSDGTNLLLVDSNIKGFMAAPAMKASTYMNPEDFSNKEFMPPVSISVRISKPITKVFSLESGISYTYLLTHLSNDTYTGKLQLHYLGVPLYIRANIWNENKWKVYGATGAMLEKGIWSVYNQQFSNSNDDIFTQEKGIDGIQWSFKASIGAAYMLYKNIDLYLEPQVSYFFDNNQPVSIRTEQPLVGGLNAGLRFNL